MAKGLWSICLYTKGTSCIVSTAQIYLLQHLSSFTQDCFHNKQLLNSFPPKKPSGLEKTFTSINLPYVTETRI